MKKDKKKLILYFLLLLIITLFYTYLVLIIKNDIIYLSGVFLFIPFYYLLFEKYKKYRLERKRIKLYNHWKEKEKRNIESEEKIKLLYYKISENETSPEIDNKEKDTLLIDDQTWQDLNLNELYLRMDYTLTSPGESVLYNILRRPLNNNE